MHNLQPCLPCSNAETSRWVFEEEEKVINSSINETVMLLTTCFQISANQMVLYLLMQHQMVVMSMLSSVCLMQTLPISMMANVSPSQDTRSLYSDAVCLLASQNDTSITAGSTHEAELVAIALAANEGVWIRKLLIEIGFALNLPFVTNRPLNTTAKRNVTFWRNSVVMMRIRHQLKSIISNLFLCSVIT